MPRPLRLALLLLAAALAADAAHAQANQFRDTRAHLGVGVGYFTYYGPVDLRFRESSTNYVQESDPALVLLGSFPLVGDRWYFRGMLGFTNLDPENERALVGTGQNEFLTESLFWFEPEVVFTLTPGSRSRLLPYLFTGFGGLIADPFGASNNDVNRPGTGIPGPERTTFHIPIGAGVDFALSPLFSFFVEGSWRFNLNYVLRNETDYDPFDTSLVLAGLRIGIKNPFREERRVVPQPEPEMPEPMEIPPYRPPAPEPVPERDPGPCPLNLVELNSVFFAFDSVTLDPEARRRLDENIEAMTLNPECCIEIAGYTDEGDDAYAIRIARQRAQAVYDYYTRNGILPDRIRLTAEGRGVPPCGKEDEGPGCRRNRRVDTIPIDCDRLIRRLRDTNQ